MRLFFAFEYGRMVEDVSGEMVERSRSDQKRLQTLSSMAARIPKRKTETQDHLDRPDPVGGGGHPFGFRISERTYL